GEEGEDRDRVGRRGRRLGELLQPRRAGERGIREPGRRVETHARFADLNGERRGERAGGEEQGAQGGGEAHASHSIYHCEFRRRALWRRFSARFPRKKRSASPSPAASTPAPRCTGCARRGRSRTPIPPTLASPTRPITTRSHAARSPMAPKKPGSSNAARSSSPKASPRS